jgi:hypothetical protein
MRILGFEDGITCLAQLVDDLLPSGSDVEPTAFPDLVAKRVKITQSSSLHWNSELTTDDSVAGIPSPILSLTDFLSALACLCAVHFFAQSPIRLTNPPRCHPTDT